MTLSTDIRKDLADLSGEIRQSRAAAKHNHAVDMSALPDRVHALCQAIQELPEDEANSYTHILVQVTQDLSALAEELKAKLPADETPAASNTNDRDG